MQVTVDNLDQVSAQDVFETIARHLLTQNKQSRSINKQCVYRGEGNLKCAAGILIPDEKYNPEMDGVGEGCNDTSWFGVLEKFNFSRKHSEMIGALQYLHDNYVANVWSEKLIDFAQSRNLNADFVLEYVK